MFGISPTFGTWKSANADQALDAKIKIDNKAIDASMAEATEKASLAHSQAVSAMVGGIVSGSAAIGSALASTVGSNPVLRGPLNDTLLGNLHFHPESLSLHRRSDATQEAANENTKDSTDSKGAADSARDHRKAGLDNIEKLLDILKEMNPKL